MTEHLQHDDFVATLLETYAARAWCKTVADDGEPPLEMRIGEPDAEGWVERRMLPSTLRFEDVGQVEQDFDIRFPPVYAAYLVSRFHLFDQVSSARYDQQVLLPRLPSHRPFEELRQLLSAWQPLIESGLIPFAQWGDGWGPMCFDDRGRGADGDCPVVWLDHESLHALGTENSRSRDAISPLLQPLYDGTREFLLDVFG